MRTTQLFEVTLADHRVIHIVADSVDGALVKLRQYLYAELAADESYLEITMAAENANEHDGPEQFFSGLAVTSITRRAGEVIEAYDWMAFPRLMEKVRDAQDATEDATEDAV